MDTFIYGIIWYVNLLLSLTLHEAAHAWAALLLGDETAYEHGQVTLDPRPHIQREPFGTVVFPILSYALGGWMMGWASAPYDREWERMYPKRAAWMALAGPLANLALVVLSGAAIRIGLEIGAFERGSLSIERLVDGQPGITSTLAVILSIMFTLNLLLFVFNLIPVPPLDGSGVIQMFMPEEIAHRFQEFTHQPFISLIGLVVAWNVCGAFLSRALVLALRVLFYGW